MRLFSLVIWALLGWSPYLVHGSKCPPPEDIMPCRCRGRNEQIQVWCSHSDLERVNGALENLMRLRSVPAIDELIVENNKMPSLPGRAFGALQIGRLLLRNNGLESISRNAFAGLEDSLEELYIVEDKLVDFPFDSIERLKRLEAFTLEKSKIHLLPRFSGLNRLKHIRIDGSQISGLPVGAFAQMASVKQIHVVNSNLGTLAEGIFGPLETLLLANFSGNRIERIQRRSFALLPKLEVLSISKNRLEDAVSVGRACEELLSLKSLDLSQNSFKTLPEGSFVNLKTLQMLNLGSNSIQTVNPRSFTHLPALRKVDLSGNELRNFPKMFFDSSPLLEELRMRKNLISTASEIQEILNSLQSLRLLDLGENGITSLEDGALADHTQIQKIDLSDNRIEKIHRDAFRNVPSLMEISLRNNTLVELPAEADAWNIPSLKELDVSGNTLKSISASTLQGLASLIRLDLSYNGIKSIGSAVFSKNAELEDLGLNGNGLSSLAYDCLHGLEKLKRLDLSRNHLEMIQGGTFRDLTSLLVLNLGNNRINHVPNELMNNLKALQELSMKSNSLNNIPANFFTGLENLKELNLKHNSIADVHNRMLSGLKNLRTLKLASNQINRFDDAAFEDLVNVKAIDISSNRINKLSSTSFKNLPALEKFEGRENRITAVDSGAFVNSDKIQVLDLAHNALDSIPEIVKVSPTLRVVDLSHNEISQIELDTFKKATNLMELYLNDNKIKELQPEILQHLNSLTIVDLDGNELTEIKSQSFQSLPRLIYLRMSRNKIRSINNQAFMDLNSLDGLDLQQNELESIGDSAFERTGSLKYLNLSHNNFDGMARMGLFSLQSLEVLDMSFNRVREVDDKALRHLKWLVELRVNDNGLCRLPVGVFDGMSRLKMLVLKNNFIPHLYEAVFYKLKNNLAFLDISGNPISCDCELIWLRNLIARESIHELSESQCEGPNDLKELPVKNVRPARMICSDTNSNRLRGVPPHFNEADCPALPVSRRKPRPVLAEPAEKPVFGSSPAEPDYSPAEMDYADGPFNDLKNRKKDEKLLIESNDYVAGDSPTIYASSSTTKDKVKNDGKSHSGLSALSNLFGIPFPSLDFGLNLGISPSVSIAGEKSDTNVVEGTHGFAPGIKGPDPLPPSWLNRPSKADHNVQSSSSSVYEPPEYIPRKPIQPYIPLNPYAESNTPANNVVTPSRFPNERNRGTGTEFPTTSSRPMRFPGTVGNSATEAWHPNAYHNAETGFIPIEPFFHSTKKGSSKKNGSQVTLDEGIRASVHHFSTRKPIPAYVSSSTLRNELNTPTIRPVPAELPEYDDDLTSTQVDIQKAVEDDMSDFWSMFSGKNNKTAVDGGDDTQLGESDENIPLNFSAPIDTELNPGQLSTSTENSYPLSQTSLRPDPDIHGPSASDGLTGSSNYIQSESFPRRPPIGKSTITKVKLEEAGQYSRPDGRNSFPNSLGDEQQQQSSQIPISSKPGRVPPVVIGDQEEPLDWYYKNYNVEQNPEEEIEKYLERSRVNQAEDILIDTDSPGSSSTSLFSLNKRWLTFPSYFLLSTAVLLL